MLSLSQTLIKLTAPGIPDIYQGSELWDLRLVDPDNRDAGGLRRSTRGCLRDVMSPDRSAFMSRLEDGDPKLRLIATALAVRARHIPRPSAVTPDISASRRSVRARITRSASPRTRPDGQPVTVTIAFRWPLLLRPGWQDTLVQLPDGGWRDALTGSRGRWRRAAPRDAARRGAGRAAGARVTTRRISVWAPVASGVDLARGRPHVPMEESGGGWFACNARPCRR